MDSEMIWDILKFPNWESGAARQAGFTTSQLGAQFLGNFRIFQIISESILCSLIIT